MNMRHDFKEKYLRISWPPKKEILKVQLKEATLVSVSFCTKIYVYFVIESLLIMSHLNQ